MVLCGLTSGQMTDGKTYRELWPHPIPYSLIPLNLSGMTHLAASFMPQSSEQYLEPG